MPTECRADRMLSAFLTELPHVRRAAGQIFTRSRFSPRSFWAWVAMPFTHARRRGALPASAMVHGLSGVRLPGLPGLIGDTSCSLHLFHPYVLKVFNKVFHVASKSVASEQTLPGASNVLLASHLLGAIPPSHPSFPLMLPETFVLTGVVHAAARLHRDHQ